MIGDNQPGRVDNETGTDGCGFTLIRLGVSILILAFTFAKKASKKSAKKKSRKAANKVTRKAARKTAKKTSKK